MGTFSDDVGIMIPVAMPRVAWVQISCACGARSLTLRGSDGARRRYTYMYTTYTQHARPTCKNFSTDRVCRVNITMATAKLSSKLRLFATNYGSASCKTIMGLRHFRRTIPASLSYSTNSRNHQKSQPTATHSTYPQVFADSITQPEEFWAEQAERVVWFKKWDKVMDLSQSPASNW